MPFRQALFFLRGEKAVKILVNGKEEILSVEMSLLDFLKHKGINPDSVVVEHNYQIVKKENWSDLILQAGDSLEVLRFVGGG